MSEGIMRRFGCRAARLATCANPNPVQLGRPVFLFAAVTPGTTTGIVTVYDGVTVLGSAPIQSGVAGLTTSVLSAGQRRIRAVSILYQVAVGDCDEDGIADLAITDYHHDAVMLPAGNGDGCFYLLHDPIYVGGSPASAPYREGAIRLRGACGGDPRNSAS